MIVAISQSNLHVIFFVHTTGSCDLYLVIRESVDSPCINGADIQYKKTLEIGLLCAISLSKYPATVFERLYNQRIIKLSKSIVGNG